MVIRSTSSGKQSSGTESIALPNLKRPSYVVNQPLTTSKISWLRQQSKHVAEVWTQGSNERPSPRDDAQAKATGHYFQIYRDGSGKFRVRFKYNGEVMFATEGYDSLENATTVIEAIKKNGPGALIEDNSV